MAGMTDRDVEQSACVGPAGLAAVMRPSGYAAITCDIDKETKREHDGDGPNDR